MQKISEHQVGEDKTSIPLGLATRRPATKLSFWNDNVPTSVLSFRFSAMGVIVQRSSLGPCKHRTSFFSCSLECVNIMPAKLQQC